MGKSAVQKEEFICTCFQVTEREIRTCIAKNDITEIEEVTSRCEAGGNCQSCHILIQLFIDQYQERKAPTREAVTVSDRQVDKKRGFFNRLFSAVLPSGS